jgi:hypothetical protein
MPDLKIKQKCEDMMEYGYIALRQFPRSEKFALAAEIKASMWRLLRDIIVCNRRYYKKTSLQDIDIELDLLRSAVRLSMQMQFLSFKKYEIWFRHLDEIGRMVGGWFKSLSSPGHGA